MTVTICVIIHDQNKLSLSLSLSLSLFLSLFLSLSFSLLHSISVIHWVSYTESDFCKENWAYFDALEGAPDPDPRRSQKILKDKWTDWDQLRTIKKIPDPFLKDPWPVTSTEIIGMIALCSGTSIQTSISVSITLQLRPQISVRTFSNFYKNFGSFYSNFYFRFFYISITSSNFSWNFFELLFPFLLHFNYILEFQLELFRTSISVSITF